jgi:subtilisin-like proprotein convertase family protein
MKLKIVCLAGAAAVVTGEVRGQCEFGVGGISIPIPDMGTVRYTFFRPVSSAEVLAARLCLRITHPRQGDLVIRLTHAGATATLLNRPGTEDGLSEEGYTASGFGVGSAWFALSDDGTSPYAVPPVGQVARPGIDNVVGVFKPTVDALSIFVGTPSGGEWHLDISDMAAGSTGMIRAVGLGIDTAHTAACYANCDGSTVGQVLTASDFMCYINKYAAGNVYANCDQSTGSPLLTANDFQCFLNKYAAGCT